MPYWICCNSCFLPPSSERKLAVSTCGHIICSVCFQKACQGNCLICNAKCQISPLSDKSSSEVKALFSDISAVATKHLSEIGKVLTFQARHQKRMMTHLKQRTEKLEGVLVKMKQEMQQMAKKLDEQSTYIAKLENSLQHNSAKISSVSQMSHSSQTPQRHKPVLQIPYNSPMSLSRQSSVANISTGNMEVDNIFRKPNTGPRLSLISPPKDGRIGDFSYESFCALEGDKKPPPVIFHGTVSHRSSDQIMLANHSVFSATASRFQGAPVTPDVSYSQRSGWTSPIYKPSSSFRHSMTSLVLPRP